LEDVLFVKGLADFQNPDNIPTLIVLDDSMDSAFSTKVSELFTKGSHHLNVSLVLITQNLFNQETLSRHIYLRNKFIVVFKNPKTRLRTRLARKFYPEILLVFIKHTWKLVKTRTLIYSWI